MYAVDLTQDTGQGQGALISARLVDDLTQHAVDGVKRVILSGESLDPGERLKVGVVIGPLTALGTFAETVRESPGPSAQSRVRDIEQALCITR